MLNSKSIIINYSDYAMLIPVRCLKWLNRPKYIEIYTGEKRKELIIHGLPKDWEEQIERADNQEELNANYFIIPNEVYEQNDSYYGITKEMMPGLMDQICDIMADTGNWSAENTYSVIGKIDDINSIMAYSVIDETDMYEADKEKLVVICFDDGELFENEVDNAFVFTM